MLSNKLDKLSSTAKLLITVACSVVASLISVLIVNSIIYKYTLDTLSSDLDRINSTIIQQQDETEELLLRICDKSDDIFFQLVGIGYHLEILSQEQSQSIILEYIDDLQNDSTISTLNTTLLHLYFDFEITPTQPNYAPTIWDELDHELQNSPGVQSIEVVNNRDLEILALEEALEEAEEMLEEVSEEVEEASEICAEETSPQEQ